MKTLITGGAGFIGSNLLRYILDKDEEVTVIDNLLTSRTENIAPFSSNPRYTFIKADVTNFDFSKLARFDTIYHLASPASPVQYKKYPIETMLTLSQGTYNILQFMKESKSRTYVLASTSEVYGDPLEHPQKETYFGNVNTLGTRSCYDEGKRFSETLSMQFYKKYNLDIRIARIFNTYGPNMEMNDGRVVSNFVVQALKNQPITICNDGTQTRSFCYISDMVEGLYRLANGANLAGEVVNLGNPDEKTINDLAVIIKQATGSNSTIIKESVDEHDPKKRRPDIEKARKLLGWEPKVSFEDGLQKTIAYFKNEVKS